VKGQHRQDRHPPIQASNAAGAEKLEELTGGWLRALADADRLDGPLTAIRRDRCDIDGTLISKEIVHAVTNATFLNLGFNLWGFPFSRKPWLHAQQ
jgi:hypothetical protein